MTRSPSPAIVIAHDTGITPVAKKIQNSMAKDTKSKTEGSETSETLDISKLTPAQLAQLQKQLKEKKKAATGGKEGSVERFKIIDTMLQEKKDGEFIYTTRDIANSLVSNNLVDTTDSDHITREIKKIQARKQFLEKKRNEKGELVHPENTFGYKASDHVGFALGPDRVTKFFVEEDGASKLSPEQKKKILAQLK